jgi:hypothetical protein
VRRRPADEHGDLQLLAAMQGRVMMHADAPVDLVMQSRLAVRRVRPARKLDAVHAQVRAEQSRLVGMLGVHQRPRHERAAVPGPALDLGKAGQGGGVRGHRVFERGQRQPGPRAPQRSQRLHRVAQRARGVGLELHQGLRALHAVAEEEERALARAEQVRDRRERRAFHPLVVQRRTARVVDAAVDLGHFEMGVDLLRHPPQPAPALQGVEAFAEGGEGHQAPLNP